MTKKQILSYSVLLISFTLVAAVTSTVAWFNGASILKISSFDVHMSDRDLKVSDSEDKETFQFDLDVTKTDSYVETFAPVSTAYSSRWINEKQLEPRFMSGYEPSHWYKEYVTYSNNSVTNTGFFTLPIYFLSDSSVYITVDADPENTYFLPNEAKNRETAKTLYGTADYVGKSVNQITEDLNSVVKSLRLSLLVLNETGSDNLDDYCYYIVDPYKGDTKTYYGGTLDLDEDGYNDYCKIYSDEENYVEREIIFGEATGDYELAQFSSPLEQDEYLPGTNGDTIFDGAVKEGVEWFDEELSKYNGFEFVEEPSITLDECIDKLKIPVKAGNPRKVVISLYLEGWDKDNVNKTKNARFNISVSFKIAPGMIGY